MKITIELTAQEAEAVQKELKNKLRSLMGKKGDAARQRTQKGFKKPEVDFHTVAAISGLRKFEEKFNESLSQ